MLSHFTGANDPSTRVVGLNTSIGRQIQVQITAGRTALGQRRYSYQLLGSDAQLTLVEDAGKTPYFKAAPLPDSQGEVLPLTAETLGIVRAVRSGLVAPYQVGLLGSLLQGIRGWLRWA